MEAKAGYFICGNCKKEFPDEFISGVVQVDDDFRNAELWCQDCAEKDATVDNNNIYHKKVK